MVENDKTPRQQGNRRFSAFLVIGHCVHSTLVIFLCGSPLASPVPQHSPTSSVHLSDIPTVPLDLIAAFPAVGCSKLNHPGSWPTPCLPCRRASTSELASTYGKREEKGRSRDDGTGIARHN